MSLFSLSLSERIKAVQPSATLTISNKAKELAASGRDVIDMSAGEPDFNTPEFIIEAATEAMRSGKTKYTAVAGVPSLREAIAYKLKSENGLDYLPEEISVAIGAKHSLYNIFQAILNPGDEILVPTPGWVSYKEMAHLASAIPVEVPTSQKDGFYLHREALEKALSPKTRALVINTPSNPTGALLDRDNLEEIAEFALKNQILVISDEIYEKLIYDRAEFCSIASLGPEILSQTITVNGLSKSHSMTGWRIGYAAGPLPLIKAINSLQSHSTSNPVAFCQEASITALRDQSEFVETCRSTFEKRRDLIYDLITAIPGISCVKPRGAFYLFPDISAFFGKTLHGKLIENDLDFCAQLLDTVHVAAVPGSAFDSSSHIRLSYAISEDKIRDAISRIRQFTQGAE